MIKKIIAFTAIVVALVACSTVSMTGRKQLNLVSESEILSASLSEYQSYMKTAKVSTDANATAIVKNVAQRIAAAHRGLSAGPDPVHPRVLLLQ